jgi:hypothetical protein
LPGLLRRSAPSANAMTCRMPLVYAMAHSVPRGFSFSREIAGDTERALPPPPLPPPAPAPAEETEEETDVTPPTPRWGASAGDTTVRKRRGPSGAPPSSPNGLGATAAAAAAAAAAAVAAAAPLAAPLAAAAPPLVEEVEVPDDGATVVRAKTYTLPVLAPSTTCLALASRHRNRTRGPATPARSGASATARHSTARGGGGGGGGDGWASIGDWWMLRAPFPKQSKKTFFDAITLSSSSFTLRRVCAPLSFYNAASAAVYYSLVWVCTPPPHHQV